MSKKLRYIGKLIQRLREERGMTQAALARQLETTQSAIARIEKGEQNLSAETLERVSDVLGRDVVSVGTGALNIKIQGGLKLSGEITTKTSKNGAVGLLCASLLNRGRTLLKSVPKIEEVFRSIEVLQSIGVRVRWMGNDVEIKPPKKISLSKLNIESATKTRSIIMCIGPLIHYFKRFSIPQAGGCKLGSRTVQPHVFALEKFGVSIKARTASLEVTVGKLRPNRVVMYESGDTVTENAIMAAALIPGKTTIAFCSANYQVQELCFFLEALGVTIEGSGTTTLIVHGISKINKNISYELSEDPIESMFFIAAAILTSSHLTIRRCPIDFLEIELLKLEKMGFRFRVGPSYLARNNKTRLVDITTYPSRLKALEEKIEARPYPGLNIDNLPFFAIIATQAEGETLIHDWVYEKRAIHYTAIEKLGANVLLADPHRFFVKGKTLLQPAEIICPPALRPSAILLLGMLGAKGTSILRNIYSINRGYEDIVRRLGSIGAKIKILRE